MINSKLLGLSLVIFLLVACAPSAQFVQTAIEQTQAANPTSTFIPIPPTVIPTIPFTPTRAFTPTLTLQSITTPEFPSIPIETILMNNGFTYSSIWHGQSYCLPGCKLYIQMDYGNFVLIYSNGDVTAEMIVNGLANSKEAFESFIQHAYGSNVFNWITTNKQEVVNSNQSGHVDGYTIGLFTTDHNELNDGVPYLIVTLTYTPPISGTPTRTGPPTKTPDFAAISTAQQLANLRSDKLDGNYLVGVDIAPGVWRNDSNGNDCYWSRLTRTGEIIDNYIGAGKGTAYIAPTDFAFYSERCGTWTYLSAP
jgi:hypothetical protein